MDDGERIVVTGNSNKKLIVLVMKICDGSYECQNALYFKNEDATVHSIFYKDNIIYLIDSFNNMIYKYDILKSISEECTTGRDPRHICLTNEYIYATNFESDNISVIDKNKLVLTGSIPAGIKPHDITYDDKNNYLYISCYEENKILEYNIQNDKKKYFNTDGKPMHIFLDDIYIYALTYFVNGNISGKINIINLYSGKIEDIIKIKGLISTIDYDYKNKLMYLINIEDQSLYIADMTIKKVIKKIYIGGYPEDVSFGTHNIYLTNSKKNQITIIDREMLTITENIDLEFSPLCIKVIN